MANKKKKKKKFIPLTVGREYFNLVRNQELKPVELFLLMVIDRLTLSNNEGCTASNERLASLMGGMTVRRVQQMLAKLTADHYIRNVGDPDQRVLVSVFGQELLHGSEE